MDRLELRLEAPPPGTPTEGFPEECRQATDQGWVEPDDADGRPRWVLLLGVAPDESAD